MGLRLPKITGQGVSCPEIRNFVVPYIAEQLKPRVILDVGCGIGVYGALIRKTNPLIRMIGLDGFLPYLWQRFPQEDYSVRIHASIRELMYGVLDVRADLRICMDVIEHFEKPEARVLLLTLKAPAIVSTPLFDYRQDSVGGNDLEEHRCVFTEKELNDLGYRTLHLAFHRAMDGQEGMMGAFQKE